MRAVSRGRTGTPTNVRGHGLDATLVGSGRCGIGTDSRGTRRTRTEVVKSQFALPVELSALKEKRRQAKASRKNVTQRRRKDVAGRVRATPLRDAPARRLFASAPKENRTPVPTLKEWCPDRQTMGANDPCLTSLFDVSTRRLFSVIAVTGFEPVFEP